MTNVEHGAGPLAGAGDRQSSLAASPRQGNRRHAERLWCAGRTADASGIAGVSRGGTGSRRLEAEATASSDHAERRLSAIARSRSGESEDRSRQSLLCGISSHVDWKRKQSAMRCWPPAAISTPRCSGPSVLDDTPASKRLPASEAERAASDHDDVRRS